MTISPTDSGMCVRGELYNYKLLHSKQREKSSLWEAREITDEEEEHSGGDR